MTDIIIKARGPKGCGKTRSIVALLSAARQMGLFTGEDLKSRSTDDVATNELTEMVAFTVPDHSGLDKALDAIAARRAIFGEIDAERRYQTEKWGVAADDTKNTPWMWTSYICQYAAKWMTGLFHCPTSSADMFRQMMIKTAAIAIAAVESLDRQRAANGLAFYETAE